MDTALNHHATLFLQNAVCSVGISSTEKGILNSKAVLQMESVCKYVPILLRRAFYYYLELEKKFKGECSIPLVNPSSSIFKTYPKSDHLPLHPLLAVWCKPSPPLSWVPEQPHHVSLFCHPQTFSVLFQTKDIVILVKQARLCHSCSKRPKAFRPTSEPSSHSTPLF